MQFSVCVSGDDAGDYPLVNRQEESRYRADKKCADDGACPECAARQDACNDEREVHDDANNAETEMRLVTDDDGNQVIGAGARVRFDDNRHTIREDDTSGCEHDDLERKGSAGLKNRIQQHRIQVDERAAAHHADDGAYFDVTPVNKQQYDDDQETDGHVRVAMRQQRKIHELLECSEQSLNQDIERVCSQVCKQEQRDAKMRDAQPDKKNDDSDKDFPETALHSVSVYH